MGISLAVVCWGEKFSTPSWRMLPKLSEELKLRSLLEEPEERGLVRSLRTRGNGAKYCSDFAVDCRTLHTAFSAVCQEVFWHLDAHQVREVNWNLMC